MTPTAPTTVPSTPPRPSPRPDVDRRSGMPVPAFDDVLERHAGSAGHAPERPDRERPAQEPDAPPTRDAPSPAGREVAEPSLLPITVVVAPDPALQQVGQSADGGAIDAPRAAAGSLPASGDVAIDGVSVAAAAAASASPPSTTATAGASTPDATPPTATTSPITTPTPDATPSTGEPTTTPPTPTSPTPTPPTTTPPTTAAPPATAAGAVPPQDGQDDGTPPAQDAPTPALLDTPVDPPDVAPDVAPEQIDAAPTARAEPEPPAPNAARTGRAAAGAPTTAGREQVPADDLGRALLARAELQRTTARPLEVGIATADLGRVRVTAADGADGLQLQLSSDRPDGRARLSEHVEELRRDLSDAGVDLGSLDVATRDTGADVDRPDADAPAVRAARAVAATPTPTPALPRLRPLHLDGLDLRL